MQIRSTIFILILMMISSCKNLINDLDYYDDVLVGLQSSKEERKPIFLAFTCYSCIGYDELGYDFIQKNEIYSILDEEYITVILHVDDKRDLVNGIATKYIDYFDLEFSEDQFVKNMGELNTLLETQVYKSNSQPLYVIWDSSEDNLIDQFEYLGRDDKVFLNKLKEGLFKYNQEAK